jgi:hypothetical protein
MFISITLAYFITQIYKIIFIISDLATNEESENGGTYWSSKYFKLFKEQKTLNHDIEEKLVAVKASLASI